MLDRVSPTLGGAPGAIDDRLLALMPAESWIAGPDWGNRIPNLILIRGPSRRRWGVVHPLDKWVNKLIVIESKFLLVQISFGYSQDPGGHHFMATIIFAAPM